MSLANANNNVNENDLFCIKDYKNKNDLQKEGPIDKAVGLNIGLPLGNAIAEVAPSGADFTIQNTNTNNGLSVRSNKRQVTATNVDIIDPYSLQACDILSNRHCHKSQLHPVGRQHLAQESVSSSNRIPAEYIHLGQCTCVCRHCGAMFWECEKVTSASHSSQSGYNKCCYDGRIILRPPPEYPQYIKEFLLLRGGKLFQQYVVTAYCAIEQSRLDYIRQIQDDIRSEYLSGIYDAILRGDRDGSDLGLRTVLTASFTGSPRYMYAHYLDALAICLPFPQLTTADRVDIVDRIFEKKVRDYIDFVRDSKTFSDVTGELPDPHLRSSQLWEKIWKDLSDDVPRNLSKTLRIPHIQKNEKKLKASTLLNLEHLLNSYSKSLDDFGLPMPTQDMLLMLQNRLLMEETNYDAQLLNEEKNFLIPRLNKDQRFIFNEITEAVRCNVQKLIFVYGHGGTGKTFLWKAVTSALRSEEKIVLTVAASGIAALLLPSADLLRQTDLIIWDEAPMNDRRCFEALDRTLKDISNSPNTLFGGKSIMLGGDFRQTLPVKKKASKAEILDASITSSYLWPKFKTYTLMENMRLHQSKTTEAESVHIQKFSTWLLDIGDGAVGDPDETDNENTFNIHIPPELCIPDSNTALATLIDFIYDQKALQAPTAKDLQKKAIVCPKNEDADMINAQVLSLVNHQQHVYLSLDEATPHGNDGGETELLYPPEYLNSLTFAGFPPHRLELKVGAPIILLRNLNISGGLCNGTRLIVTQLLSKVIEARIITGTRIGEKVFLPRIPLINQDLQLPFIFKRKQFPIKLCYAMTINKSQGQSLERIGIFLPEPVFAHGQLYVALSRATSPQGLKILIKHPSNGTTTTTKNIVYKDFLATVTRTQVLSNFTFTYAIICSLMTEGNAPTVIPKDKGKLPLVEAKTISIADINPTQTNQTIEVRVYRKWLAKNVITQEASNYCAILLDKKGNAIQANMDLKDRDYFNDLLQLNNAYRISRFKCIQTKIWDRTLPNDTTLVLGKYTSIIPISNTDFPEHHFNFVAYNEVDRRANMSGAPLTDYIGCIYRVSDPVRSGDATRTRRVRRIIDVQNLDGINLPFLIWAEMAENFDVNEYNKMDKPVIIAIASAWANRKYGGLQLSATSATHYYLNPHIPEAKYIMDTYANFINPIPALEVQRQPYSNPLLEQTRNRYTIEALLSANPQHYQVKDNSENSQCHNHGPQPTPNYGYCFKAIIDDGTATTTVTCFSPEAHTFVPDCNTVVNTIEDRDTTHVPTVLKQAEGHTYIFQYRFGQNARVGYPNFTLVAVLQSFAEPLLALPAAESIKSPAAEILEQTSMGDNPTTTDNRTSQTTKPDAAVPSQTPQEKANKTRRGLFQETDAQGKKPRRDA
ncbi:DNA helicase [Tanacetum coccineum]